VLVADHPGHDRGALGGRGAPAIRPARFGHGVSSVKKIYVGNLPWSTGESDLKDLFARFGKVHSAAVITDRETGRSRGFGFIEMDDADAENAIAQLNGREFGQRTLRVNEAQDRGGDGGDRRGGGGGGRAGRW
jgi:RNA recognition motif-containing protein